MLSNKHYMVDPSIKSYLIINNYLNNETRDVITKITGRENYITYQYIMTILHLFGSKKLPEYYDISYTPKKL